jgi:hypothetical protein
MKNHSQRPQGPAFGVYPRGFFAGAALATGLFLVCHPIAATLAALALAVARGLRVGALPGLAIALVFPGITTAAVCIAAVVIISSRTLSA